MTTGGLVVLIGGHEDKHDRRIILSEVARRLRPGRLVIATLASEEPELQWFAYSRVFRDLGIVDTVQMDFTSREEAMSPDALEMLEDASGIFFTGGDQTKITAKLGGTTVLEHILQLHADGGMLAGTSAGAAVMGNVMPVAITDEESHKVRSAFQMTRGLGIVPQLVVDQHFAQRARIERLVAAVAENPSALGIGIDEDTAVLLQPGEYFDVLGSGAVYVADGHSITYTNMAEQASEQTLCLFDLRLHVLCHGTRYSLVERRPSCKEASRSRQTAKRPGG
jgi:cyanophycinase